MDVISNTCAVWRWIVIPEDIHERPLTKGSLQNQWDNVCFRIVIFAQLAIRICPGCIKIPQTNRFQLVGSPEVIQYLFNHDLGSAVRTDRFLRVVFGHRDFHRLSITSTRRREYEIANVPFNHGLKEGKGIGHIVLVVLGRLLYRFIDITEGSKVHHS